MSTTKLVSRNCTLAFGEHMLSLPYPPRIVRPGGNLAEHVSFIRSIVCLRGT